MKAARCVTTWCALVVFGAVMPRGEPADKAGVLLIRPVTEHPQEESS